MTSTFAFIGTALPPLSATALCVVTLRAVPVRYPAPHYERVAREGSRCPIWLCYQRRIR